MMRDTVTNSAHIVRQSNEFVQRCTALSFPTIIISAYKVLVVWVGILCHRGGSLNFLATIDAILLGAMHLLLHNN